MSYTIKGNKMFELDSNGNDVEIMSFGNQNIIPKLREHFEAKRGLAIPEEAKIKAKRKPRKPKLVT
jgi:hypothetical protein